VKPLAIDLFAGLGGWTEGLLAEGYAVVGFDNERHVYGDKQYPAQLVLQDVLTIHGSQFKDAALIVASPPCQEYSYMAMPWSRAKNIAAEYRSGVRDVAKLNALFNACFRIQKEASEAAGRHIPMVVENVRGAQPWVGRAAWNYGSFYLWGDVPALMPITFARMVMKQGIAHLSDGSTNFHGTKVPGLDWSKFGEPGYKAEAFNTTAEQRLREGLKVPGMNFHDYEKTGKPGRPFQSAAAVKNIHGGSWFGSYAEQKAAGMGSPGRMVSSKSPARKAASAEIAKIPLPLARHIARVYLPMTPNNIRLLMRHSAQDNTQQHTTTRIDKTGVENHGFAT